MGRIEKLLERLQNRPKDFTFEEVQTLLAAYGYILSNSEDERIENKILSWNKDIQYA
ncbi:hypothetical protein [Cloacibacillus porcorum]|uniref:hypothetical protein n=1 Tax=Cloacibacillus porcorum TaxID=1197717 RepID=UPI003EFD444A